MSRRRHRRHAGPRLMLVAFAVTFAGLARVAPPAVALVLAVAVVGAPVALLRQPRTYRPVTSGPPAPAGRPTALYRWHGRRLDGSHGLLYVGISTEPVARLSEHRQDGKSWTRRITGSTVEWFPDRRSALAAELAAIRGEGPEANIAGRGRRRMSA